MPALPCLALTVNPTRISTVENCHPGLAAVIPLDIIATFGY